MFFFRRRRSLDIRPGLPTTGAREVRDSVRSFNHLATRYTRSGCDVSSLSRASFASPLLSWELLLLCANRTANRQWRSLVSTRLCNERKIFHERDASYVSIPRKRSVTFSGTHICVYIYVYVRHNVLSFVCALHVFRQERQEIRREQSINRAD